MPGYGIVRETVYAGVSAPVEEMRIRLLDGGQATIGLKFVEDGVVEVQLVNIHQSLLGPQL